MTYAELVARIETAAVTRVAESADFATALPGMIADAETRCLRDCDFPSARKTVQQAMVPGAPAVSAPAGLVVPRALWIGTGAGFAVRVELERRDASYLRDYWPNQAAMAVPRYFATVDVSSILVAPTPALAHPLFVEFTFRPPGLSNAVTTTWLSENYADLLFAAVMIGVAGWQRNFGAQADDPQMPGSWGAVYAAALATARNEARTGKGWGAFDRTPSPPPAGLAVKGG